MSHSGIVSKRLNLSENYFDLLKAPSLWFFETPAPIQNSTGNPFSGGVFRRISPFISETVRDSEVNACCTDTGATPLHVAAYDGHTEVVKLLLDHKAEVNACCTDTGVTPLFVAAQNLLLY